MTRRSRLLASVATLSLTSACSSYGVAASEHPVVDPFSAARAGEAKVCVVRGGAPAPLYTTVIYDNGKLVGATRDGTYFCYTAESGKHVIVSDGTFGSPAALLTAQAGRRYYLKQAWLLPAVRGHALSWIDEPAARDEMQGDEYSLLTEVPGHQTLPDASAFAPAAR